MGEIWEKLQDTPIGKKFIKLFFFPSHFRIDAEDNSTLYWDFNDGREDIKIEMDEDKFRSMIEQSVKEKKNLFNT